MSEAQGSLVVEEQKLSGAQEVALGAIKGGQTFVRAAQEARVSRMTLYRWLHRDPQFRAAYNAWQQEATESARARLVKLADKAVDVVESALERNDEKVALKVLHGTGVLRKRAAGSINADVLHLQMELKDKKELRRAEIAMLVHLLEKMGMPAEQRQRVLAGGPDAAALLAQVKSQSARRGQPAEGQAAGMGANQGAGGPVTSEEPEPPVAAEGNAASEDCNYIECNDLHIESLADPGVIDDVTPVVTDEGV